MSSGVETKSTVAAVKKDDDDDNVDDDEIKEYVSQIGALHKKQHCVPHHTHR